MQILHLFSFTLFFYVSVFCMTKTINDTEEFKRLFSEVFLNRNTENRTQFFSVLKKLNNVCQCAYDQLNKTYSELTNTTTEVTMMKNTLKALMANLPLKRGTKNDCTYNSKGAWDTSLFFNRFYKRLNSRDCGKKF